MKNMGGRDQSQVKIKFKKFKKSKSVPKDVPNSHNDDNPLPLLSSDSLKAVMLSPVEVMIPAMAALHNAT